MNLRIGQQVVCICEFSPENFFACEVGPKKDAVYTIRAIDPPRDGYGFYSLLLREIVNPAIDHDAGIGECSFNVEHFRPVVERKTSIEIFERMTAPSRFHERV